MALAPWTSSTTSQGAFFAICLQVLAVLGANSVALQSSNAAWRPTMILLEDRVLRLRFAYSRASSSLLGCVAIGLLFGGLPRKTTAPASVSRVATNAQGLSIHFAPWRMYIYEMKIVDSLS
jgi:hypothetical protein